MARLYLTSPYRSVIDPAWCLTSFGAASREMCGPPPSVQPTFDQTIGYPPDMEPTRSRKTAWLRFPWVPPVLPLAISDCPKRIAKLHPRKDGAQHGLKVGVKSGGKQHVFLCMSCGILWLHFQRQPRGSTILTTPPLEVFQKSHN